MAYAFGQGGNAIITINGSPVTVCLTEWSMNYDLGVQDLTTTCSGGFRDLGTGIQSAEVTAGGFYDATESTMGALINPDTLPIEFRLGETAANVSGNWLVKSFKITNPATQYITFEAVFGSTGTVTVTE